MNKERFLKNLKRYDEFDEATANICLDVIFDRDTPERREMHRRNAEKHQAYALRY